jgi:molybdopterin molybdotransferase
VQLALTISLDEAQLRVSRQAAPVGGTGSVSRRQASGRILAEPLRASAMTPPFDTAATGGYAMAATPFFSVGTRTSPVSCRVPVGQAPSAAIGGRTVARVFTRAPVPHGAVSVVR